MTFSLIALIGWIVLTVLVAWNIRGAFQKKKYNQAYLLIGFYILVNALIYWLLSSLIEAMG